MVGKLPMLAVCLAGAVSAAEIRRLETGTAAEERGCALSRRADAVDAAEPQFFVRFLLDRPAPGERIRIEWVNPSGQVAEAAEYSDLPRGRAICVINALQVGGFPPATQPGRWTVRVVSDGRLLGQRGFEIRGRSSPLAVRVAESGESVLVLDTWGSVPDTTVNIARYRETSGWEYVAVLLPSRREGNRIWVNPGRLDPGEYLVILRNPDGAESLPARFLVSSSQLYKKPFPDAETWQVTQRPYGSFSHFGRALHAWDFAPVRGRYVAAMRAGTVIARDLGLGQTPGLRSFGNYITIRHDDGTFAHYAHLRTGTFRVRTGERVEAGQVLAEVGNSGYSFGRHVHVHVTRQPSITAPSVPFSFVTPVPAATVESARARGGAPGRPRWTGEARFAEWWSRLLPVPKGVRQLVVRLGWDDPASEFDLYLVNPRGEWIRAEGREIAVPGPEPGTWRVSVQNVKGGAAFWLEPEITPARP
ncbi:MAG: peptidoglycan DD-metalloendopeptidase family protein [Bryobacteraceae bacterium]